MNVTFVQHDNPAIGNRDATMEKKSEGLFLLATKLAMQ